MQPNGDKFEGEVSPGRWIFTDGPLPASVSDGPLSGSGAIDASGQQGNLQAHLASLQTHQSAVDSLPRATTGSSRSAHQCSALLSFLLLFSFSMTFSFPSDENGLDLLNALISRKDGDPIAPRLRSVFSRAFVPGRRQGSGKETLVTGGTYVG